MTKNGIVLSVIALVLAIAYVCFFTDWFNKETIQIIPQIRPGRQAAVSRGGDSSPVYPVSFSFDGKYKLTSVKVVAAGEFATNKYANPLWHLVSDSNSVPIKSIVYGYPVKGMKPAIPRARPEPLQPEIPYVLLVEAGKVNGRTNFHTREVVQPNAP